MYLPDDITLEIFSWLPAESIYKFKCVDKFFNAQFSNDTLFIKKQSKNSLLRDDDSCFFIQPNTNQRYSATTEFHHLCPKKPASSVSNKFLQFLEHCPSFRIVASSNGLILGRNNGELFMCNPVTQSWLPISTPNSLNKYPDADLKLAFECNLEDSHDDFMLFLFEVQDEWASQYDDVKFYFKKEGMWKATETSFFTGARSLRFDMHVYRRKALHFISDCSAFLSKKSPFFRPYIMAYNVEDGRSRMLRLPKEARTGSHDSTAQMVRLRKNVFTVWVLTDYEVNQWRRILKIRVEAIIGLKDEEEPIIVTGFTVSNGKQLIFATKMKVYGFGLSEDNYMIVEEVCEHGFESDSVCFTCYSDTLHHCGDGATIFPLLPGTT
ncbi:uncharacterized protein LOC129297968 [Prosopis cineraria]|uniref:uncharacterized protein LOC129297968 n=1 Tax=Prosopis cineraria TaxID=364024 RepID=UPI0024106A86|nr:uncharacterized protein LOC129297968 [Prosopis cineraria]